MTEKLKAVAEAYRAREEAERALSAAVAKALKPGDHISWERGGNVVSGYVETDNRIGDLEVTNDASGKTYWISIYNVLRAYELL